MGQDVRRTPGMSDQRRPGSGTGIWTPDVRVWDGRCTTWKSDSSLNYGKSQVWKVYSEANAVNEEDPERDRATQV